MNVHLPLLYNSKGSLYCWIIKINEFEAEIIFKGINMSLIKSNQTEQPISENEMLNLANRFLLSIKSRNWELLRMIITKDCVWRWPGDGIFSGTVVGEDSVVKQISDLADRASNLRLLRISYGLNGVALSLHFNVKIAGGDVDEDFITVCSLRGYKISGINSYLSDDKIKD